MVKRYLSDSGMRTAIQAVTPPVHWRYRIAQLGARTPGFSGKGKIDASTYEDNAEESARHTIEAVEGDLDREEDVLVELMGLWKSRVISSTWPQMEMQQWTYLLIYYSDSYYLYLS